MRRARALFTAALLACWCSHAHALVSLAGSTRYCSNASAPLTLHDAADDPQPARCADARGAYAPGSILHKTSYDNLTRPELLSPLPPANACVDAHTLCAPEPHTHAFFTDAQYICVCAAGWFRAAPAATCTRVAGGRGLVSPAHTDALFACTAPSVAVGDACEATAVATENGEYMGAYLLPPETDTDPKNPPPLHLYAALPCPHAMRHNFTTAACECDAGYVASADTGGACALCPRDHYCPGGARQHKCDRTLYAGARSAGECVCAAGSYRTDNHSGSACIQVPENDTSAYVPVCTRPEDSGVQCDVLDACPDNTRCAGGLVRPCPDGRYFDPDAGPSRCAACELGFRCSGGARHPCPAHASTRRVGAVDLQQCRCAHNYTAVAGLGHLRCRYVGAHVAAARASERPPPRPPTDFGARVVHWRADAPAAFTAAALEHIALEPVRANRVRLHVHAAGGWRTLGDLGLANRALVSTGVFSELHVSHDAQAPALLSVVFLRNDTGLDRLELFRVQVNTSAANLTLARAHQVETLAAQDEYANGTHALASPARAALALLRCRRTPVYGERNVTREVLVIQADNGTDTNTGNATYRTLQVLATVELARPRACTLTLFALDPAEESTPPVDVALAAAADGADMRWHADGRLLCVNATHYIDAESGHLQAWAGAATCAPLPRAAPSPDAPSVIPQAAACVFPLVRVGDFCTACPTNHRCDAAGRIVPCPPRAMTVMQDASRCVCGAGLFLHSARRGCMQVPAGGYSGGDDADLHMCPRNQTSDAGATGVAGCKCVAGFVFSQSNTGATSSRACVACARGTYQPAQNQSTCLACEHGTTAHTASTSPAACVCAAGFFGTPGTGCKQCPEIAGVVCPLGTAREQDVEECDSSKHRAANAARTRCVCEAGTYQLGETCRPCGFGWFCNEPRGIQRTQCPRGMHTARVDAASKGECECTAPGTIARFVPGESLCECDEGYHALGGSCARCPPNSCTEPGCDCLHHCARGYHTDAANVCRLCARGSYCTGQHGTGPVPCPRGTYGIMEGQSSVRDCVRCDPGVVLAAGEEAAPHDPPHLACAGVLVRIAGSALAALPAAPTVRWQARGQEAVGASATVAAAVDKLAFVLRSPNVTQEYSSRTHAGQLRVSARAHAGFAASLFAALQRGAGAEWSALRDQLAVQHDRQTAVAQYLFCALLWHQLRGAWESSTATESCEAEAEAGEGLPAHVQYLAREAVRAALDIDLYLHPGAQLGALPELSVLRQLVQTQLPGQDASYVHLSVVAKSVIVTWSQPAAVVPVQMRQEAFWRALEPMLTVTGVALAAGACGVLPSDERVHIPYAMQQQLVCTRCLPGREFRDTLTSSCLSCTPFSEALCHPIGFKFSACNATANAECERVEAEEEKGTCRNGKHTLDEVCDPSDKDSPLQSCCTSECKLKPGYYAFPACSTICGDDILADGVEECDQISAECDLGTCTSVPFL